MFIVRESYIKKLIRLVEESDIESLEVSTWGRKVKITHSSKGNNNGSSHGHSVLQPMVTADPSPPPQTGLITAPLSTAVPAAPIAADTSKLVSIKSPMVGTFYAAPSPDADPYVSVNQKVTVGQVVCIVEAMKLMNEIESEFSGRVVKVLVENGKPVEFGQDLFQIEPD
jgi:acetyl-CoA carboxylase biotin carboxyl carrier protein